MSTESDKDLRLLIRHYVKECRPQLAALVHFYTSLPSLEQAISDAAMGLDERGKKHRHQYRLSEMLLAVGKRKVWSYKDHIGACSAFDQILHIVDHAVDGVRGFGELYKYDTAFRIGAKLGIFPETVYLHRGTRVGVKRLGLNAKADFLPMERLPSPLQVLMPYEAEDFLCIYKNRF